MTGEYRLASVLAAGRWSIAIAIAFACSAPPPPAPGVVIESTPSAVCFGDNFQTQVHLDSRGSSPTLTLVYSPPPPDAGQLDYLWTFSGNVCLGLPSDPTTCDVKIDPDDVDPHGNVSSSDVFLTMSGTVPLQFSLTVTIEGGGATTIQSTVPITALEAGVCP